MKDDRGRSLILLRQALYGWQGDERTGLFPEVRRSDAGDFFSKIWKLKGPYSPMRQEYVLEDEYLSLMIDKVHGDLESR